MRKQKYKYIITERLKDNSGKWFVKHRTDFNLKQWADQYFDKATKRYDDL